MNLEDKLKEKFGNQNPFSVPENYFDDFANKMQDLVKEESPVYRMEVQSDRRTLFAKVKPYLYLAAMFCGLYFGINVIKYRQDIAKTAKVENAAAVKNANSEDVYIEEVCEYAGIDKEHIYAYATGQDYDY